MARMRVTIERLRTGIVVLAVLLVVAILLFFGIARFERRRLGHDLPAKLGIHIQQSADGFTFSKSEKGRTLFTLHASKVVQYKGGGRATLHDVSITLYGKQGDRTDRIYGADFDYDPAAGIARAGGDVELDLQAPDSANSRMPQASPDDIQGKSTIHVKTSGLVFDQKTGIASTEKRVEFRFPQAAGKAVGASYDSQKGLLVLTSAVEMSTSLNGDALMVHSSHAEFLRSSRQAFLLNVVTEYQQDRSVADQAIVYFRPDGSAEHLDAKGNIRLAGGDGRELTAQTGVVELDRQSQPHTVRLAGGVLFHAVDAQHQMRGSAVEGTIEFGDKATLRHAQMRNAVTLVDQQSPLPDDPRGSLTREVRANQLDIDFAAGAGRRSFPRHALAAGRAALVLHTIRSTGPQQNAMVEADTLFANLGDGTTLTSLEGKGHTRLTDASADGATQTSTGDTLAVKFVEIATKSPAQARKTAAKSSSSPGSLQPFGATEIQSALQLGNVKLTQTPAKKDATTAPPPMVATAQRALYTGSNQTLHLEGSPRITDGNLEIAAQSFVLARATGDASARGDVKSTYQQGGGAAPVVFGGQGPVHIVAEQASLLHATGDAVFHGQARLWQGTNSVAAPVIELSRAQQTLKAHGEGGGSRPVVSAALLIPSGAARQPGVVRLQSRQLDYSDAERKGVFRGSVSAEDATGTIRSDEVEVVLAPVQQAPGRKGTGVQAQVDRMIATGHVSLEQAGRKGTGERLIYTAQDGLFVLSGTASALPRLTDQTHGSVTGDALIFNSRDDSVSVSGGRSGAVTETHVPR